MTDIDTPARYVVLLRGINVNPSTLMKMGDLRDILTGLGYTNVKTLLRSGNVILDAASPPDAEELASAITAGTGVKSPVVVLSSDSFRTVVATNPLRDAGDDLSKLVITFLHGDIVPADIERPSEQELEPEQLVITSRAVYQWLPDGILKSKLKASWWKQFGPTVTARNVRTTNRILEELQ